MMDHDGLKEQDSDEDINDVNIPIFHSYNNIIQPIKTFYEILG